MTSKVLGFKQKDAKRIHNLHGIPHLEEDISYEYKVKESKLVPVVSVKEHRKKIKALHKHIDSLVKFANKDKVSVEWLEKWCKEHKQWERRKDKEWVPKQDLLLACKKEARKE